MGLLNEAKASGRGFDLILTDLMLPEVSGFDLIQQVVSGKGGEQDTPPTPVVVMSSVDSQDSVLQAFEFGAADYLIKPLRKNEVSTLWQHIWRHNKQKAMQLQCFPPADSHGQDDSALAAPANVGPGNNSMCHRSTSASSGGGGCGNVIVSGVSGSGSDCSGASATARDSFPSASDRTAGGCGAPPPACSPVARDTSERTAGAYAVPHASRPVTKDSGEEAAGVPAAGKDDSAIAADKQAPHVKEGLPAAATPESLSDLRRINDVLRRAQISGLICAAGQGPAAGGAVAAAVHLDISRLPRASNDMRSQLWVVPAEAAQELEAAAEPPGAKRVCRDQPGSLVEQLLPERGAGSGDTGLHLGQLVMPQASVAGPGGQACLEAEPLPSGLEEPSALGAQGIPQQQQQLGGWPAERASPRSQQGRMGEASEQASGATTGLELFCNSGLRPSAFTALTVFLPPAACQGPAAGSTLRPASLLDCSPLPFPATAPLEVLPLDLEGNLGGQAGSSVPAAVQGAHALLPDSVVQLVRALYFARAAGSVLSTPDASVGPGSCLGLVASDSPPDVSSSLRRKEAVAKYLNKRNNRSFQKRVRYESRKKAAESRPRVRGQFVKQDGGSAAETAAAATAAAASGRQLLREDGADEDMSGSSRDEA